jgi:hypothetical protein
MNEILNNIADLPNTDVSDNDVSDVPVTVRDLSDDSNPLLLDVYAKRYDPNRGTGLVLDVLRRAKTPITKKEIATRVARTRAGSSLPVKSIDGRVSKATGYFTRTEKYLRVIGRGPKAKYFALRKSDVTEDFRP